MKNYGFSFTVLLTTFCLAQAQPSGADEPSAITPNATSIKSTVTSQEVTLAPSTGAATLSIKKQVKKSKPKGNGFLRRMLEPVTDLQSQSLKLQEQIVKLERPIENLQPPMIKLEERVRSVEDEINDLQKYLSEVKGELIEVHSDISGVREQITKLISR